ncbi:hypothetical protein BGZ68_003998 [Mortierella alpina]|nr:hypothetical protein BGZ68_003998 [Mortierella alpina]
MLHSAVSLASAPFDNLGLVSNVTQPNPVDIKNLYNGQHRKIKVDFPDKTKEWSTDPTYGELKRKYYAAKHEMMPSVPAVMTYCDILRVYEEPRLPGPETVQNHSLRVVYKSLVLVPYEWTLEIEPAGAAIMGNALGTTQKETTTEETTKFSAKVDFNGSVSAKGTYGIAEGSTGASGGAGASWEKSTTVVVKATETIDKDSYYQPVRICARLKCHVLHAKDGWFAVHSSSGKWPDSCELITTNPPLGKPEPVYWASGSGYHKTLEELNGLYDACGRELVTYRHFGDGFWSEASSAKLKMVVDPADAMLYVAGRAGSYERKWINLVGFLPAVGGPIIGMMELHDLAMVHEEKEGPMFPDISAKLDFFAGLYSTDDPQKTEQLLSYSLGKDVEVWKTVVKVEHTLATSKP